jgi:hypothetical protein
MRSSLSRAPRGKSTDGARPVRLVDRGLLLAEPICLQCDLSAASRFYCVDRRQMLAYIRG